MSSDSFVYARRMLGRVLIIITCITTLVSWYFISPQADAIASELYNWNVNIGTFTLFVGLFSVYAHYIRTVRNRGRYWTYCLFSMILIPVWVIMGQTVGLFSDFYLTAYYSTKITLHVAIIGQLMFFMMSGAYRTFRVKNFRTALFAGSTLVIVICNASWMTSAIPAADTFKAWLLDYVSTGGYRPMVITGGLGAIVLGARILLGLERGALTATEET